jgi:hypothetical protein
MRIDSSGNVGIGTTSPATKLNILVGDGTSNGTAGIRIGGTNNYQSLELGIVGAYGGMIRSYGNDLNYYSGHWITVGTAATEDHSHYWYTSKTGSSNWSTAKMALNHDGNLGIGTTTPSAKLDVSGDSVQNVGLVRFTNNYASGNVYYPTASFIQTRANHSYGIVSEFRTNTAADSDRPSILFYAAQAAHSWQVGQVTSGWGTNDNFGIGYRASNTPGSFSAWPTNYFTITTGGNVGIGTASPGYKLEVNGSFAATTKSFVIPHPTKEGKKLRYGSLEGPENGVYVRGKTTSKIIELPDYWTKLVDAESITVQLTPIGSHQKLYVEKIEDNKVYIANENLVAKSINCFYYILAERADVEKLEVEIDA